MTVLPQKRLYDLYLRIRTLVVFRGILSEPPLARLMDLLEVASADHESNQTEAHIQKVALCYADFVSALFEAGSCCFASYLQRLILDDENAYLKCKSAGKIPHSALESAAQAELNSLEELSKVTPQDLLFEVGEPLFSRLAKFEVKKCRIVQTYQQRLSEIHRFGYGMYARYHVFRLDKSGRIAPVLYPDPVKLSSLIDYEREKKIILDNTYALLDGKPAANILLTGAAGTGKSSTVKAIVNELATRGLRILEVQKEQLHYIPALLDELTANPLCFIIFIDDLSFASDDDNFSALKAILEGSVSAKSDNVVIYATSNRRHLIKESFSDRDGDDVHFNDTMQQLISLSDRFGIHISFYKPDMQTYLHIVHQLAEQNKIAMPQEELDLLAERFATRRGGRSPRGARQFIDSLLSR